MRKKEERTKKKNKLNCVICNVKCTIGCQVYSVQNVLWSYFIASTAISKKQSSGSKFKTTVLKTRQDAENDTLVYLTALQVDKSYFPLLAKDACAALKSTSKPCMDAKYEINVHKKKRNFKDKSGRLSTEASVGVGLSVVIFCLLAGAVVYKLKERLVSESRKTWQTDGHTHTHTHTHNRNIET